jgi:hypothetical protein
MTDTPDTSPNLGLPFYLTKLNEFEVQHNEALLMLDALVMLSVIDRDLSAPPSSPSLGDRYLVKAASTGDFAGEDNRIAQYDTGGWNFYAPQPGWTCYVLDEQVLLMWDGDSWEPAFGDPSAITELQNLTLLGVGTTADGTNPLSAKLNNALWVAQSVAEGGSGDLRYVLSKESAAKTLSLLLQDGFSGRAEIGLTGDDDFHFKTSPDGSTWIDALVLDKTTGSARFNAGLFLSGDISPSQITADQNDYNPAGLAQASTLRLSSDASRAVTGLSGGGDGRVIAIINVGSHDIVLKDASTSSAAGNRFDFGADLTLGAKKAALLWYDAADSRWKPWAVASGVGPGDSPQFAAINLGHASDTTLTRTGAGDIAVEGNGIYRAGGAEVAVADGGTGASTDRSAAANLHVPYVLGQSFVSHSTSSTSEVVLATVAIPANAIGPNGCLRITSLWNTPVTANTRTPRVRFGASGAGTGGTIYGSMAVVSTANEMRSTIIGNKNSAALQVGGTIGGSGGWGATTSSSASSSVDTTAASEVVFTGQLANGADTVTLVGYIVEVCYAS